MAEALPRGYVDIMNTIYDNEQRMLEVGRSGSLAEIVGLVEERGVMGFRFLNRTWVMEFQLLVHRVDCGKLRHKQVLVHQGVPLIEFPQWRRRIWPGAIIRVKARYGRDRKLGYCALFVDLLDGNANDPEIEGIRWRERGSRFIDDELLGTLVFDEGTNEYLAVVDWCGQPGRLYLETEDAKLVPRALANARRLYADRRHWRRRINKAILGEFFGLKNDGWLIDGENPVGVEEFLDRLSLDSISVAPNGAFRIFYGDGGLFYDHAIFVEGSLRAGVKHVSLFG